MGIFLVYIGIFFAVTGGYAIIQSLNTLGEDKADSSIQMSWFKMNAPAGFVYGIISIGIVVALIKYSDVILNDEEEKIAKTVMKDFTNNTNIIEISINKRNPISIFNGKVLIQFEDDSLKFKGIDGISTKPKGLFTGNSIHIEEAMKFYFKLYDSSIMGVNVISKSYETKLEIYKENYKIQ